MERGRTRCQNSFNDISARLKTAYVKRRNIVAAIGKEEGKEHDHVIDDLQEVTKKEIVSARAKNGAKNL